MTNVAISTEDPSYRKRVSVLDSNMAYAGFVHVRKARVWTLNR